jgi:hypothetical protein
LARNIKYLFLFALTMLSSWEVTVKLFNTFLVVDRSYQHQYPGLLKFVSSNNFLALG